MIQFQCNFFLCHTGFDKAENMLKCRFCNALSLANIFDFFVGFYRSERVDGFICSDRRDPYSAKSFSQIFKLSNGQSVRLDSKGFDA